MKCPDCGCELEEGKLYCPKCGREIQMVPDFDPEIEEKMSGALEGITSHIQESEKAAKQEQRQLQEEKARRRLWFLSIFAGACVVILFVAGSLAIGFQNTVESQLAKAQKAAEKKDYARAVEYVLRAVEKDGSDLELRSQLGNYYLLDGQTQNAITTFRDIIDLDGENEEAYRSLIGIYEQDKDYEAINALIRASNSEKIVNMFTRYIANPPEFNYEQGTYDKRIALKLTANTSGTVYYTLDGTEPNEQSSVYQTPIFLENGIYTVKAFFRNEYGIESETAVQVYEIHLKEAHEPEVSLDSGQYTTPQMITVIVPDGERIYYTIDGSTPSQDSIPYYNPIALPIGGSIYQFISYNEDGAASPIVRRDYTFLFEAPLDIQTAVATLVAGLVERGVLVDMSCAVPGKGGRNLYVCSSAVSINSRSYYLMVEYYEDMTGIHTRTGNMYCVDAETGALYQAAIDDNGYYSVVSF